MAPPPAKEVASVSAPLSGSSAENGRPGLIPLAEYCTSAPWGRRYMDKPKHVHIQVRRLYRVPSAMRYRPVDCLSIDDGKGGWDRQKSEHVRCEKRRPANRVGFSPFLEETWEENRPSLLPLMATFRH